MDQGNEEAEFVTELREHDVRTHFSALASSSVTNGLALTSHPPFTRYSWGGARLVGIQEGG